MTDAPEVLLRLAPGLSLACDPREIEFALRHGKDRTQIAIRRTWLMEPIIIEEPVEVVAAKVDFALLKFRGAA